MAFLSIFSKKEVETDEALLKRFKLKGHQDDLALLFDRYIALMYGICLKYLQNKDDAQDACMELYEKLKESINRFEIAQFKSWLAKTTVNHCLMIIRTKKRNVEKNRDLEKDLLSDMETEQTLHPMDDEKEFRLDMLTKSLDHLKEDQKNCILLFYFQKHSYTEIAQLQNLTENEVKSYIQNGKRNLKILITKSEKEL